jgi:Kelch motif
LFGGGMSFFLAACGGGGDGDSGEPAIQQFSADRSSYFVGERAQITVRYRGASARIEPFIGDVANGAVITTSVLGSRQRLRLVVSTPGLPSVARDLFLDVRFRDRWQTAQAFACSMHAAVTTAEGQVLVIGGSRGLGVLSDSVDRFDPATGRYTRIGTLATGRSNHTAVRLADGRVLVCGGQTSTSAAHFAELVDETTGQVQHAGLLTTPRNRHTATLLGSGRVLVTGGQARSSAELWEPATNRWRPVAAHMAHDRQFHTATALADGRMLIAGGLRESVGEYVFAELFDPQAETFTPLPGNVSGVTQQRQFHAAHLCNDRSVLILGGEAVGDTVEPLATVLRFDPTTLRFTSQAPLNTPRTLVASVRLPGDDVLLIGGEVPGDLASHSGVQWHAGDQRALAPLPGGRAWHTVNRLPDGRVVVIGGETGSGDFVTQTAIYE